MVTRDTKRIASRSQKRIRMGEDKRCQQRNMIHRKARSRIQVCNATAIRQRGGNRSPQATRVRCRMGLDVTIPSSQRCVIPVKDRVTGWVAMLLGMRVIRPVEKRRKVRAGNTLDDRMGKRASMRVGRELGTWLQI